MYLAVSGNIGSGKSTLTRMLAARYGLRPVYEPYADNPYLEDFYQDMRRYSFHSQVYFLSRRLEQHLNLVTGARYVIQDRTVFEDANIFARNLFESGQMEARDWATYCGLYEGVRPALRVPDLLIHIDAALPTLKRRIAQRGRTYEQDIPEAYLGGLNRLYDSWIAGFDACPVVRVPGDELDFVADPEAFEWVCARVQAHGFGLPLLR
ncbi:deoxynucleoside kinase [Deinococcus sp. HMF7620]|uniref:Deoxynucleoside kinase n=1 Tax=Deinococcus arboris TaxID=2682977 RepID=A0A7C9I039_9DEIO|nr:MULTISPECIES: deoxynucleoside kinase [Deinococcus]MBZ9750449.1 deoxynucleoside kinase [Deinococcus betulae]MVN87988.1 deoxynucleoside kinase [Deinococcus arboris]